MIRFYLRPFLILRFTWRMFDFFGFWLPWFKAALWFWGQGKSRP